MGDISAHFRVKSHVEPDHVHPAIHVTGKAAYEMRALDYGVAVVEGAVVGENRLLL